MSINSLASAITRINIDPDDDLQKTQRHQCSRCILSRPEYPQIYKLLHKLPRELQHNIIRYAVIETPCVKHVFRACFDPWSCKDGSHSDTEVVPSLCVASMCCCVSDEAFKQFYRNSVLVFNRTPLNFGKTISQNPHGNYINTVDPRAILMLDFLPGNNFKARHLPLQNSNDEAYHVAYDHRHRIRHLVLKTYCDFGQPYVADWNWVLKIDWACLPKLETLVLDLRAISLQPHNLGGIVSFGLLEAAINRMSGMKLQSLIIVGLCSGQYSGDRHHKRMMREAFKNVLDVDGKLEFIDWEQYGIW